MNNNSNPLLLFVTEENQWDYWIETMGTVELALSFKWKLSGWRNMSQKKKFQHNQVANKLRDMATAITIVMHLGLTYYERWTVTINGIIIHTSWYKIKVTSIQSIVCFIWINKQIIIVIIIQVIIIIIITIIIIIIMMIIMDIRGLMRIIDVLTLLKLEKFPTSLVYEFTW